MEVEEFRKKIKSNAKLSVEGKIFDVREVVRFRFDDGTFYIKCFLSDNFVLADDLNENIFLLVKEIKTDFLEPFPEELDFDGKKFKFLYAAHAVAEEILGEEIFKKGEGERFWDFKSENNNYLSLGISDKTNERMDFCGKIIPNNYVVVS